MLAFIGRRLGALIVILFGSSFLLYNLAAISGDPIGPARFSTDPIVRGEARELEIFLRLDVPPPLRYFIWLRGVLGIFAGNPDFGQTRGRSPVLSELLLAIPITIRLVLFATIIAIALGIALGIVSALRQYTRFDYSMTFFAFLLFSLPIFWVAVLLKRYLAISFNNFLVEPNITLQWRAGFGFVIGLFFATLFARQRSHFWMVFVGVAAFVVGFLTFINEANLLLDPRLGPLGVLLLSTIICVSVTYLSTGFSNKASLNSALTMIPLTMVSYFLIQGQLDERSSIPQLIGYAGLTALVATIVALIYARQDRAPVVRTSIISAVLSGGLIVVDKLLRTWKPYMEDPTVDFRPIPTIGQANDLLPKDDFWLVGLDLLVHLFLPTLALTLISFAGYVRYSRGTLLEVLNQDYIRTARAKGLTERTVIMRHAFRNTMIPITTLVVVDFAAVVGGAIITEQVFGWQGMGTLFNRAISTIDLNLLMGVFSITATMAVLANIVADLLYSALDPRIRVGSDK